MDVGGEYQDRLFNAPYSRGAAQAGSFQGFAFSVLGPLEKK